MDRNGEIAIVMSNKADLDSERIGVGRRSSRQSL